MTVNLRLRILLTAAFIGTLAVVAPSASAQQPPPGLTPTVPQAEAGAQPAADAAIADPSAPDDAPDSTGPSAEVPPPEPDPTPPQPVTAKLPAAPARWMLTDSAGIPIPVQSIRLSEQRAAFVTAGGEMREIGFDALSELVSADPAFRSLSPESFVLMLRDGRRVAGAAAELEGESIRWANPILGTVAVPLVEVRAIVRLKDAGRPPGAGLLLEDQIALANGDMVSGILESLDAKTISMLVGADTTPVPWEAVQSVRLAGPAGSSIPKLTAFRVELRDGSIIDSDRLTEGKTPAQVVIRPFGSEMGLDLATVRRVTHRAGPIQWIADRAADVQHTPVFTESSRTEAQSHDLIMQSRSRLTIPLDGSHRTFGVALAVDADFPYADAVVRVSLDGVTKVERRVRAGETPGRIDLDLAAATSLTLEVDYGNALASQDRIRFVAPALFR